MGRTVSVPPADRCLELAAHQLREASVAGHPEWQSARALTALAYIALAEAQEHAFNPEDAADWHPPDDDEEPRR